MKELISTITAAIGAFLCIAAGAWFVSEQPHQQAVRYSQIHTDKATHYPYVASADRGWAVEMVR